MKKAALFILLFPMAFVFAGEEISIWPGDAPGTEGRSNEEEFRNERYYKVHQPSLTVHLPPRELATGAAVLVCPGGGWGHVTIFKEGHQVASWLNSRGIAAFVLKYRIDKSEAVQDALQSMELIRENSEKWAVNPAKVGVIGFSAGGNLLLRTVSASDAKTKPNFLIMMYASIQDIDLTNGFAPNASPSFIAVASDDQSTPPENSIEIYRSLYEADIPSELHIYKSGGHGYGLGNGSGPVIDWTDRCEVWLKGLGYLDIEK